MESGLFLHERRILQQLKARGFRAEVVYDLGASTGIWSEAIHSVFPAASYHLFEPLASHIGFYREDLDRRLTRFPNFHLHEVALGHECGTARMSIFHDGYGSSMHELGDRPEIQRRVEVPCHRLDEYAAAHGIPAPQVVKIDTQGAEEAILSGSGHTLESAQVLIVETWLDRCYGPKTPLLGEIVERLRRPGFSLVEFGERFYDDRHHLYSVDAFFFAEPLMNTKTFIAGASVSALARRIETLTGRVAGGSAAALHQADAIISHIEMNQKHGVGVLLDRWFRGASNVLSIRSADQFGGRQDFGAVALRISHRQTGPDDVYARVLGALGSNSVGRILCVPYYPDDARTAIAIKEIFGVPMCTFMMDDSGIEEKLMRTLLEKSALRLAISPQLREAFERKFGLPVWYMPPLAPARWIPSQLQVPDAGVEPRHGAILGNVWGARWLDLLRKTVKDSGVTLAWYSNAAIPGDGEALRASSIFPQEPHADEALVRALRRTWFAVLPSGTLDARDDRHFIARHSLPSRLIYMMATSQIPVIVLGSRETAAAQFVERSGIGLVADYDRKSFGEAVDRILKRDVNLAMRTNALAMAGSYADTGAAEWIWQSLARGAPFDRRFEEL